MISKKSAKSDIIVNPNNTQLVKGFEKLIGQIKFDIDNAPSRSESMINHYRLRQISNVLEILKKYPKEIKKGEDLKGVKGVGKGSIKRINEILKTGKLEEVKTEGEHTKYMQDIEALEEVIGIGRKTAYELVKKYGIKNVAELKKAYTDNKIELDNQIMIGLKYYGVYKKAIPRLEVDMIYNYVSSIAAKVDPELFTIICGSYRRLKPVSNDIDVLVTHPLVKKKTDIDKHENYLRKFVSALKASGFLIDDLTDKDYKIKYMGFCRYKNKKEYPIRRIDIRYIPYDSYYTAILYFTGSGEFNRKMRNTARVLGYILNEYGLYKIVGMKKVRVTINSEKDVFDKLGMEYLTPEQR